MTIPSAQQWKSRPIFISSTFRDMQAERDYLRNFVLPRLEEALRARRHHLEWIDLRQGVESGDTTDEGARERIVLKVCLDEIKRSRPFIIVLLGHRYGWIPDSERLAAAINDAGFQSPTTTQSVTALEIEFGILQAEQERQRGCFFYLRDPLPYAKIPSERRADFDDQFATDSQAGTRRDSLAALKHRLRNDPGLKPRVRTYQADWDPKGNTVTGLEALGKMVFQDVWRELEAETRAFATRAEPTWEEQERSALGEFVEQHRRHFTGRDETIGRLLAFCLSPAAEEAPWATWVTGPPGSGKSAVCAALYHRLQSESDALVLANAAGVTQRGSNVDAMLRRWIAELGSFLGRESPLAPGATDTEVNQAFASLLGQAAARRRVVVLLDALDQFEPTPRAAYLTWRPTLWPANARLVVTATPTAEAANPLISGGIEELRLPSFTDAEARNLAQSVGRQYHVPWADTVWVVLAGRKLPDGTSATANPLWTTLACEQLALLDADQFEHAERDFSGDPQSRLVRLRCELAGQMPPDVPALYEWFLQHTSKVHSQSSTWAFTAVIGLSRQGWREEDFRHLLGPCAAVLCPGAPAPQVTPLRIAGLRRAFRAHLRVSGESLRLDFSHAQMRQMTDRLILHDPAERERLHALIADYLANLGLTDPVRNDELGYHLLRGGQPALAAAHFARLASLLTSQLDLAGHSLDRKALAADPRWRELQLDQFPWANMQREFSASLESLVSYLRAGRGADARNPHLEAVLNWLRLGRDDGLEADVHHNIVLLFGGKLVEAIENDDARISLRLMEAVADHYQLEASPDDQTVQRMYNTARSLIRLGDQQLAVREVARAEQSFRRALPVIERICAEAPECLAYQQQLGHAYDRLGTAAHQAGRFSEAEQYFTKSMGMAKELAAREPAEQRFLRDVGEAHLRFGRLYRTQNDYGKALPHYVQAVSVFERLNAAAKDDFVFLHKIGESLQNAGELAVLCSAPAEAEAYLRRALAVAEQLVVLEPAEQEYQFDHALIVSKMTDALMKVERHAEAREWALRALKLREQLHRRHPTSRHAIGLLCMSYCKVILAHATEEQSPQLLNTWLRFLDVVKTATESGQALAPEASDFLRQTMTGFVPPLRNYFPTDKALDPATVRCLPASPFPLVPLLVAAAWAQGELGSLALKDKKADEALTAYERAAAGMERVLQLEPEDLRWWHTIGLQHFRLALTYHLVGRKPEALAQQAAFSRALAKLEQSAPLPQNLLQMVSELDQMLKSPDEPAGKDQAGAATGPAPEGELTAADLYSRGDLDAAEALCGQQEPEFRRLGDKRNLAAILGCRALIRFDRNDLDGALAAHREEETLYRDIACHEGVARSLFNQTRVFVAREDNRAAQLLYEEAERLSREHRLEELLADCLVGQVITLGRGAGSKPSAASKMREARGIYLRLGLTDKALYATRTFYGALPPSTARRFAIWLGLMAGGAALGFFNRWLWLFGAPLMVLGLVGVASWLKARLFSQKP